MPSTRETSDESTHRAHRVSATALGPILTAVNERVSYLRSATAAPATDGWIQSGDLVRGGPLLAGLIATTGEGRATTDPQVGASLFVQGYAFRIAGVALAAYALGYDTPSTAASVTAIQIARHRPAAIAYLDPVPQPSDPVRCTEELLGGHLAEFVRAVRGEVTVGERLLWGNIAASCAVAFRAVEGASADDAPRIRERAETWFAAAQPWLRGLGEFVTVDAGARQGWFWARTNCCLWYQTAGASMCDDCSLLDPDARLESWRASLEPEPEPPPAPAGGAV